LISFGIAAIFISAFIWWEKRSPNPMLPMEFFKNMSFTGANIALTISSFGLMGGMYFFSQFFQSVQGFSPLEAALRMLPMSPVVFSATLGSVRINRRLGTKATMSLGLLLSSLGLFLFSQTAAIDTPYWTVLLVLAALGTGIGFTVSPATSSVMNSLPPNRAGIGSAMNDTTRQLGAALGVAVLGAVMNGAYRSGVNHLSGLEGITESMLEAIRGSVQSAHLVAIKLETNVASVVTSTSSQAFVNGMREALLIGSIAMLLAAVAAWLLLPEKEKVIRVPQNVMLEE
jgi:predicted MFS family arabinose efflux permease